MTLWASCFCLQAQQQSKMDYPALLTVAADGSGDYTTINEAIQHFRAYSPIPLKLILKKGVYREKVLIPHALCNLTIEGTNRDSTIITFDDYSGKLFSECVTSNTDQRKHTTFTSYTLAIYGNDIHLINLTIRNTAGRVGQAVALHVEGDRITVDQCNLLGNQDTLFTGNDTSRQWYTNCYIEGTTDFIFGPATALFQDCEMRSLSNSYITAASTPQGKFFGYVFDRCRLTAAAEVTKVYLGRPWRKYARTVWIHSQMGTHIHPAGWHNWNDPQNERTAFYAEYQNNGPGADTQSRVSWSRQLQPAEQEKYTPSEILGDWVNRN